MPRKQQNHTLDACFIVYFSSVSTCFIEYYIDLYRNVIQSRSQKERMKQVFTLILMLHAHCTMEVTVTTALHISSSIQTVSGIRQMTLLCTF